MGAIVGALRNTPHDTGLNMEDINAVNGACLLKVIHRTNPFSPRQSYIIKHNTTEYWEECRGLYAPFESGQKSGSADVYLHEMPGGQYTNLLFQSSQLGLSGTTSAFRVYVKGLL